MRLRATGVATARGPRPAWLARTVDFTVTGFGADSTTGGQRTLRLGETAAEFGQRSPDDDDPPDENPHDTALGRRYALRLEEIATAEGEIRSATLEAVLTNLRRVAERVVRLRATGVATARGPRPAWLARTVDFRVTGFGTGAPTVGLRAPLLRETAAAAFGKSSPEDDDPPDTILNDTALDLVSETVRAIRSADSPDDWVDRSVVEAVAALGRSAGDGAEYALARKDGAGGGFELDAAVRDRAEEQLTRLPESRTFVVSGFMDCVQHGEGRFRLRLPEGQTLAGQLDPEFLDFETLREFWGRPATVIGMVHFHPDGRPRVLVARNLDPRREGDVIFEDLPWGEGPGLPVFSPELVRKARKFDWNRLKGLWKIEQSTEEILELCRQMREDP